MPLLKKPRDLQQEQVRIRVKAQLLDEIKEYCDWVGFNVNAFFEEAAEYILKKDKEWNLYKKQQGAHHETEHQK